MKTFNIGNNFISGLMPRNDREIIVIILKKNERSLSCVFAKFLECSQMSSVLLKYQSVIHAFNRLLHLL